MPVLDPTDSTTFCKKGDEGLSRILLEVHSSDRISDAETDSDDPEQVQEPDDFPTFELKSDAQRLPGWVYEPENLGDASRVCDPVKPGQIWKNYRARRGKTGWHLDGRQMSK
ncbi:hypothetical protein POX_f08295 [Penicillium oxalicum]|uniref:hypothetical protein n=1 Tax=Penicillium oxalicum TaxID=69781 RepID=UPI0020B8BE32|nr:hypothetical protein POX_f08295 [Penicillium oxalicum]KAI2787913.1 hypothetical protein POX_f08295 [Penicillium oxalicum]